MPISFNTVAPALTAVHKIIPFTITVIKSLTVRWIVEPAFTRYNIRDAEGKKWSVKQQQHGNCSSGVHWNFFAGKGAWFNKFSSEQRTERTWIGGGSP